MYFFSNLLISNISLKNSYLEIENELLLQRKEINWKKETTKYDQIPRGVRSRNILKRAVKWSKWNWLLTQCETCQKADIKGGKRVHIHFKTQSLQWDSVRLLDFIETDQLELDSSCHCGRHFLPVINQKKKTLVFLCRWSVTCVLADLWPPPPAPGCECGSVRHTETMKRRSR